ncbi:transmembrane channel-like protein 7 isoform X2 [Biomphalaria glabrata]|uniref:Transmembrane channel-like protein 7 isoform X2 n=1 Tax=Biomphalaria glabrata TaxID=6526 RepID=A0A9W2ZL42_BIOGL|nr:transmembrane channel-like protein 7 isoform X2 [Biomphalaria glabrata]
MNLPLKSDIKHLSESSLEQSTKKVKSISVHSSQVQHQRKSTRHQINLAFQKDCDIQSSSPDNVDGSKYIVSTFSSSIDVIANDNEAIDAETLKKENETNDFGLPSFKQRMQRMQCLTLRSFKAKQERAQQQVAQRVRTIIQLSETQSCINYTKRFLKGIKSMFDALIDLWYRLNFWSQQFREIEGHFGIATSTYFRFTRWLVNLNFMVFFLYLCFIYIPQLSYNNLSDYFTVVNDTGSGSFYNKMVLCSKSYKEKLTTRRANHHWLTFLDIAQGTGFLENTMLFYGFYSNLTVSLHNDFSSRNVKYNMGLGYLLTVGISFVVVFIMIVRKSSTTIKETVMDFDNTAYPLYTNAVFGGWDYCINSEKMSVYKQRIIYNEFKATLWEVKMKKKRENRSTREKSKLYLKRLIINLVVLALLVGSFYTIYLTTDYLIKNQTENLSEFNFLMVNYLPSIVISILNAIVPEIFWALSKVEEYSNSFATHITIVRAVFLRLSSVWVLVVSLYYRLHYKGRKPMDCPEENMYNVTRCCGNTLWESIIENDKLERRTVKCWESYVGQQFYKLCITDFMSVTLIVLSIKIPRRIIHHHLQHRIWVIKKLGRAKFDLPLQVLDIVYSQTVCWMGMFFNPLLPALTFIKVFYFFFLKKVGSHPRLTSPSCLKLTAVKNSPLLLVETVLPDPISEPHMRVRIWTGCQRLFESMPLEAFYR